MESLKVMVIGVDGATFEVINPLVEKGLLPNFARFFSEGMHGPLRSTIHPITPQAWSSFFTGKNAGKHGVFDFIRRREGSYGIEFVNASRRSAESIFMHLSRRGSKVGCIAVPFTYPPEPVNGFMLSGMDSPAEDERAVYPPELLAEIRERFGNYYIHLASPIGRKRVEEDKFWRDIQAEDRNRTDIGLYLWDKTPTDLFMTAYTNTDRVQHQYFTLELERELAAGRVDPENLIVKTYVNVDRQIGKLLERADAHGNTAVFIISDHGSGPIKRFFYLNRWLELNGYLAYLDSNGGAAFKTLEMGRYMAKRFLPRKAKNFMKTFLPGVRDRVESYRFFNDIDWSRTKAYGFGMYGNIFINLKGREPGGIVEPGAEYEDMRSRCIEEIEALTDPESGEKIVEKVYRKEDLYRGEMIEEAPDLIICWKDYSFYTSNTPGRESGDCFGEYQKVDASDYLHIGTHRLDGVFMALGPVIKKDERVEGARITDIAPTILYALGEDVPEDMDGRVLKEVFERSFTEGRPVSRGKATEFSGQGEITEYSDEDSKEVEERLKGLGYL